MLVGVLQNHPKSLRKGTVRVRKAQPPARSMRYLLSVDRSLRRVSLRKISVRVKSAKNRVRSRSAKKDAARETPTPGNASVTNRWPSLRPVAPALIGIVAAVTLIGVPGLFQRSDSIIASVQPVTSAAQATQPPDLPLATTTAATEVVPTSAAAQMRTSDTPLAGRRMVESARTTSVDSAQHSNSMAHPKTTPAADFSPNAGSKPFAHSTPNAESKPSPRSTPIAEVQPAVGPLANADLMNEGTVTISGCLEARDDSFWLKDTSGANAPKSRSWKSGFLKKHAESVHVVDATSGLRLSNYVAQRVTATGTLVNRTMQARSLELVAGSCH